MGGNEGVKPYIRSAERERTDDPMMMMMMSPATDDTRLSSTRVTSEVRAPREQSIPPIPCVLVIPTRVAWKTAIDLEITDCAIDAADETFIPDSQSVETESSSVGSSNK